MKRFLFLIITFFLLISIAHGELSVREKIETRSMPSITAPFTEWVMNRHEWSYAEMTAAHDMFWAPTFGLRYQKTDKGISLVGNMVEARRKHDELIKLNPNMLFIMGIVMRSADPYADFEKEMYSDDNFPWIRSEDGSMVFGTPPERHTSLLIDFTHPIAQDMIVGQAVAVWKSGLYDGIIIDNWNEEGVVLKGYRTLEEEQHARVKILQRIRAAVGDDLLILVNCGCKLTLATPYINGITLELYPEQWENYTHKGLMELEDILLWAEENLQEPQVNELEARGIGSELPTSPNNLQGMRRMTTLSLTHSDGYLLYGMGVNWGEPHTHDDFFWNYPYKNTNWNYWNAHTNSHDTFTHEHLNFHYWYDFWDADLGQPVGERGQLYQNREGLFIREFTNGWAVYNRSGKTQTIEFTEEVSAVASGVKDNRRHTVPDLDGEIYLKTVVQVAPGEYPPLYWIDAKTDTLQRLVDTEIKNLVSGVQNATSLTIDTVNKKLYWTEKTGTRTGKIQSATLEGNPNIQLVRNLTSAPLDIAIDTTAGKLYLSNAWGKIQRMNLDGSNFQPNLIIGLKAPQNLVLDTTSSQLYWTEQTGKTTGNIKRANLDGSNVRLVKKLTSVPRGMSLDAVNRKLYLTNAWGKLQRMSLDGSGFQPNFITGLESPGQVVVDRVGGKVYWRERGKLRRADLNGENIRDVVTGLGELADIVLGIQSVSMDVAAAPVLTAVVEQTQLLANYPNPFNPETWIPYQLANPSEVRITIYDTRGTVVRHLELGHQREGYYTGQSLAAYWDGRNTVGERVASGVYFYQLQADNLSLLRKMLILK